MQRTAILNVVGLTPRLIGEHTPKIRAFMERQRIARVQPGLPAGVRFIEAAQFMSHLANIGDTRTLIIHPASTTHRQLEPDQQIQAGVLPDMVRMSVGIEHIDDILWDIDQALAAAARG